MTNGVVINGQKTKIEQVGEISMYCFIFVLLYIGKDALFPYKNVTKGLNITVTSSELSNIQYIN